MKGSLVRNLADGPYSRASLVLTRSTLALNSEFIVSSRVSPVRVIDPDEKRSTRFDFDSGITIICGRRCVRAWGQIVFSLSRLILGHEIVVAETEMLHSFSFGTTSQSSS